MKKLTAILLLATLMFNWVGYRFVISYVDYSNNRQLEAQLDQGDYKDSDLIELKIPISLPYQVNWNNFERFSGQIEIDGIHYEYVKRKVHNDSLVLMCLPNHHKTEMQDAKTRFFALVNDLNTTDPAGKSEKKQASGFKNLTSECLIRSSEVAFTVALPQDLCYTARNCSILLSPTLLTPERPPASV